MAKNSKTRNKNRNQESVCSFCENKTTNVCNDIESYWSSLPPKRKLSLLQISNNLILSHIKNSSSLGARVNNSCICVQCKKQQQLFTSIIKVFEHFIRELSQPHDSRKIIATKIQSKHFRGEKEKCLAQELHKLQLDRFLTVRDNKITVTTEYVDKYSNTLIQLYKKIDRIFVEDKLLMPNNYPTPDTIHKLINFPTISEELLTKKAALQRAAMANFSDCDEVFDCLCALEEGDNEDDNEDDDDDDEDDGNCDVDNDREDHLVGNPANKKCNKNHTDDNNDDDDDDDDDDHGNSDDDKVSTEGKGFQDSKSSNIDATKNSNFDILKVTSCDVEESLMSCEVKVPDSTKSEMVGYESSEEVDGKCLSSKKLGININNYIEDILHFNLPENKVLFHIYVIRLFFHNIRVAFKEMIALKNQEQLIKECELESKNKSQKAKEKKKKETKIQAPQKRKTQKNQNTTKVNKQVDLPIQKKQFDTKEKHSVAIEDSSSMETINDWSIVQKKQKKTKAITSETILDHTEREKVVTPTQQLSPLPPSPFLSATNHPTIIPKTESTNSQYLNPNHHSTCMQDIPYQYQQQSQQQEQQHQQQPQQQQQQEQQEQQQQEEEEEDDNFCYQLLQPFQTSGNFQGTSPIKLLSAHTIPIQEDIGMDKNHSGLSISNQRLQKNYSINQAKHRIAEKGEDMRTVGRTVSEPLRDSFLNSKGCMERKENYYKNPFSLPSFFSPIEIGPNVAID